MAEYDIDKTAAADAAALLRDLLQTEVPTGDFTQGSAASDILIDGHAVIAGYLSRQIETVRQRQSLMTLKDLPASESVNDAADAILDNFFRRRSQGAFAKGVATLRFSQRQDILIPRTTRFFKTSALVFYIDSDVDLFIPGSDLRADIDVDGLVASYSTTVFLTAARVGPEFNIAPGRFVAFDRFNALLTIVENLTRFSYGNSIQSTSDFISKSTNAIALRALINARSNDAVLIDKYVDVETTTTVGYGDPEMIRDVVSNVSNNVKLHVGGHMDIYVRQNVQEAIVRGTVGVLQPRNDNQVVTLRHTSTTPSGSFITAGVVPGDILALGAGTLPEAPSQYVVTAVRATELDIDVRTPFSIATAESVPVTPMLYTVGNNYPDYNNKVQVLVGTTDAVTSRQFSEYNRFELPAYPVYAIKQIELLGPLPAAIQPYANTLTGNVMFTVQKNSPTPSAPPIGSQLGFYVTVKNPEASRSSLAMTMIELGWPTVDLTGCTVDVALETPTNFNTINAYVSNRMNRPACANTLLRAYHPIYLYISIPYRPRITPVDPLSTVIPVFDPIPAAATLTEYLNAYRETEALDVSLIATKARETSAAIAAIYTFLVRYDLLIPDGRIMHFETADKITVFPDGATSTARLTNPTDFGLPDTGYYAGLTRLLKDQGVTDRVTRYRVAPDGVAFVRRV
jgi:hypothetical protein